LFFKYTDSKYIIMDNSHLRIIANPYLLKQRVELKSETSKLIENNDLLYRFLDLRYKDLFINPIIFYKIIQVIDGLIQDYEIDMMVDDIINSVISDNM